MTILGTRNNSPVITIYLTKNDATRLIRRLTRMVDTADEYVDCETFNADVSVVPSSDPSKEVNFSVVEPRNIR